MNSRTFRISVLLVIAFSGAVFAQRALIRARGGAAPASSSAGGSITVTAANGLSGSGTSGDPVVMAAAGAAAAGAVTTGTQTIAGAKSFSSTVTYSGAASTSAFVATEGAYYCPNGATCSNKVYGSVSGNLIIHPQSTKQVYFDITSGTGNINFNPDKGLDIGQTGAFRPGNIFVGTTLFAQGTTGDAIDATAGGYTRIKFGTGAPTAGDCDAAGESGRLYIDTSNHRFYWCEGAAGWFAATKDTP